jgi:hypothetical protein
MRPTTLENYLLHFSLRLDDMRRCKKCVLPETFPGIRFDDKGICNFCQSYKGKKDLEKKKSIYRKRFRELIERHKGKGCYDVLMSYSGGKDSTYTLLILKEKYRLNILAVTVDNGFLSETAFKNIRCVTENFGFDHIFLKPRFDILKKIFLACSKENIFSLKALTRASTICTSCIAIVKFSSLRIAIEKKVPFIAFGWSPGQIPITSSIMKNNPHLIGMTQKVVYRPLYDLVGDKIRAYFLEERHFECTDDFPYNVSPLAFLDYNEKRIKDAIAELGWIAPDDVDVHSTNCLLNSYANIIHKEKYGYHPYVFEMAKLVREGYLARSEALRRLNQQERSETVISVKKKLEL